ncbi:MAG: hypothetical protein Q4P08_05280 [Eubacteriales bacterium]|nr:hypothetical protein [Eubacteriales bacterium]
MLTEIKEAKKQADNLTNLLARGADSQLLLDKLAETEAEIEKLQCTVKEREVARLNLGKEEIIYFFKEFRN